MEKLDRSKSIGGSDMPVILGLSSYKTPYVLYLEKLGLLETDDTESELQYWGKMLEPSVINHFARINNVEVISVPTKYHPTMTFLRGSYDGFIPAWNEGLEVKCSDKYMRNEWGEDGTDVIPMPYIIQCAHYCLIENVERWNIGTLIGGNEYRQFVYNRDKEIESMIVSAAQDFWNCVQNQVEPGLKTIEDCKLKYRNVDPDKAITADEAIRNELNRLAQTKKQIKELERIEKEGQKEIMEYMQSAECITDDAGKPLVTWKATKNGYRRFALKGVSE